MGLADVKAIRRAFKVQADEGPLAVSMVALTFTAMAGLAIGQSGASALFLDRVGTDALPVIYLLQGAAAFAVMLAFSGALARVDRRRGYLVTWAGLALVVLAERALLLADARWVYGLLWVTVAIAFLVQNVLVWGIAGVVTNTRRAKRLFPLFAGGEILGSVAGGLLTRPLVGAVGAEELLLLWAGALLLAFGLCRTVLRFGRGEATGQPRPVRPTSASVLRDLSSALAYVRRSPLLVSMALAGVLFSVLFFSLLLPWAAAATERYPNADDLAGFFGLFWAAITGLAFAVSVLGASRLFGRFGIAPMLIVLPLVYVGAFGTLLVSSTFVTLVVVRFAAGVWLQGVASPAWETLTNVVPDTRRDQVRAFLNGGPAQAGTVIAGVIALVGQEALSPRQLAVVGLVAAAITVLLTWRVRRSYATALVHALRAGRPQVFPDAAVAGAPFTLGGDAQALSLVLDAAEDEQPSVRRLAVQLLSDVDDERARLRVERALEDPEPGVRAGAVEAFARWGEGLLERLEPLLDDPDPEVAASAAAGLAGRAGGAAPTPAGRAGASAPAERLRALAGDPDPAVRQVAFERLGHAPSAVAAPLALEGLRDEAPQVRAAAVLALANAEPERAMEPAVRLLEDASPTVRDAAARANVLLGEGSVTALLAALERPSAREAALQALEHLELAGREGSIGAFVEGCVAAAAADLALARGLPPGGEATGLLRDALVDRARRNGRSALRAAALVTPDGAAARAAIDNLEAREEAQVANALETLEATVETSVVRRLLPLWERTDAERLEGANDGLERIGEDDDGFIVACGELALLERRGGDEMARARVVMPVMERVLFLRKVPLFEALAPADLHAIAQVAQEQTFGDGDQLAGEGEIGDTLHIVASGVVRVEREGSEIARRGPGDVVGEMSLITRGPRVASLVAEGDVRAIRIGRREFESMVHDRPDIALGVMRVLAQRLGERPDAGDPVP